MVPVSMRNMNPNASDESETPMVTIKVLGPGCANCKRLEGLVRKVIDAQGLEAQVDKITD
jgi:hypothetical protein